MQFHCWKKKAQKPFQDPWRPNDLRLNVSSNEFSCVIMIHVLDIPTSGVFPPPTNTHTQTYTPVQWLEEFLPYLAGWAASVKGHEGLSIAKQNKMILSAETRLGLQFTGIAVLHYKTLNI